MNEIKCDYFGEAVNKIILLIHEPIINNIYSVQTKVKRGHYSPRLKRIIIIIVLYTRSDLNNT